MAIYKAQTSVKNYLDVASSEPKNPTNGQKWLDGKIMKVWNAEKGIWEEEDLQGQPTGIIESDKMPSEPYEGMLWKNSGNTGGYIVGATYRWDGKQWLLFTFAAESILAGEVSGLVLTSESQTGKFRVEGQHAELVNTSTNEKTELSDNGLKVYDSGGKLRSQITRQMVNSSYFGTSNVNTYITTGGVNFDPDDEANEGGGEFRVVQYDPKMATGDMGDNPNDYYYANIRANALFANVIRVNYSNAADVVNNNLYLQPRWGNEVRVTAPGTTGNNSVYQDLRAKNLYANVLQNNGSTSNNHVYIRPINSGELRVTAPGTTDNFRNIRANNIYLANIVKPAEGDLYIGTSGKVRIMGRGLWEDSNYRPIVSSAFQNPSLETFKTNIRRYEDSALSIIDNAEIYNYELKSDVKEGTNETHIGLIIGDDYQTPDCIKSDDNSAIDLYAMSSLGWKAIQELSEKVKDLRSEMDLLRRELNNE